MSSQTDLFLEEYKRLEYIAVERYGFPADGSAVLRLEQRREFRTLRAELDYCREVRNLLQHKPKLDGFYAVEPSEQMVQLLRDTIEIVENPPKARTIAIPREKVYFRTEDDFVCPAMREMLNKSYTDVPIMNNGVVTGVFSENTLLSYLVDEELPMIEDTTTFADLRKYVPLENHQSEAFAFVSVNATVADVQALFEENRSDQKRLGMVFLTENGKPQEKLLGIITAWDLAGVVRQ